MLKALELIGFKSFADKTRFAFPPGITVVVGPNGSGKSNIVDAIKWVLGAQSVKSLRGKEMVDVIFNGSGSRRPVNTAEVTLTFNNAERRLAIDAQEVAITRRVYRSGEGEYLINRQACRLRDIRDLFAGTGIATEAYSVIEQGKVDILLQSSPRDRRTIFEEASGISRFKAKKLEASRRLERVDQNLLRLSDIVEEVESRLRSVRSQASKARRYREYAHRLKELRTRIGRGDWLNLSAQLDALEQEQTALVDRRDEQAARLESLEAASLQLETELAELENQRRQSEMSIAENRERIAGIESTIQHERSRRQEIDQQMRRHRRQLFAMTHRAGTIDQQVDETQSAAKEARQRHERAARNLANVEKTQAELNERRDRVEQATSARRSRHIEHMRTAARLGEQISGLKSLEDAALAARNRCQTQLSELDRQRDALAIEATERRRLRDEVNRTLAECEQQLAIGKTEVAERQRELAHQQKERARLEGQLNGARERAAVLAELERRLEGLGAGVKQILASVHQDTSGPYRQVRGLVADLIHVKVETAPLVEVALGEFAQYLVIAPGSAIFETLERDSRSYRGRVGFLRMEPSATAATADRAHLEGHPGVLGRADRFVEAPPEYAPLVRRLLEATYFVETLSHGLDLAQGAGRGCAFVTLAGEKITPDGAVVVGPRHAAAGIISRRSELRALRERVETLSSQSDETQSRVANLEQEIDAAERRLVQTSERHMKLTAEAGEQRLRATAAEDRLEQLGLQQQSLREETRAACAQLETAAADREAAQTHLADSEHELEQLEQRMAKDSTLLENLRAEQSRTTELVTRRQVELARCEQHLDLLHSQLVQFQKDQQERQKAVQEIESQLKLCARKIQEAEQSILASEAAIAELYLTKEALAADTVRHRERLDTYRTERSEKAHEAQQVRQQIRLLDRKIHEKELEAGRVAHERNTLASRLREDYDIDVASQPAETDIGDLPENVEEEIEDLRRKLNNIGGVNLESLEELDELEQRYESLAGQHRDLEKAKESLERIITRINGHSRRLFADTLEAVRGHFQSLFRKLFGGGQADIVLEDDVDILESGIEIVARPPGKEPRSISLLSGGEKTLTCVALLLAIFRNRPSPFCVLDEVDAALDEANIGRFIAVLNEFLSSTQFVVVTHSKKTMTAATTLYGVTMQESGVSKRVSVRFEDISDDGEIRDAAMRSGQAATTGHDSEDETQAA